MIWVVEYNNGKTVSENEENYKQIDKSDIKFLYLVNKEERIGVNCETGLFFVNEYNYDFKIGNGPFHPIFFKKGLITFSLNGVSQNNHVEYNIGISKYYQDFKYSYVMKISTNSIYLEASKENTFGIVIDRKRIKIR